MRIKQSIKPIVSLVAFLIGVLLSKVDVYAAVIFSPFAIFLLFHLVLLVVVLRQLVVREVNRSQVIGKGILAVIVWLVPSLVVFSITLSYMIRLANEEFERTPFPIVVTGVTTILYGLVGWGLFRWVRNPDNEGLGIWEKDSRSSLHAHSKPRRLPRTRQ